MEKSELNKCNVGDAVMDMRGRVQEILGFYKREQTGAFVRIRPRMGALPRGILIVDDPAFAIDGYTMRASMIQAPELDGFRLLFHGYIKCVHSTVSPERMMFSLRRHFAAFRKPLPLFEDDASMRKAYMEMRDAG